MTTGAPDLEAQQAAPMRHYERTVRAIVRWSIPLAALLVGGPIVAWMVRLLRAPDGSREVTLLNATSPVMGVLIGVGVVLIAGAIGIVASRIIGARRGMISAGLVLAWAGVACGPVDAIIRRAGSGSPLTMMAIEALVVGVLGVGVALLIGRADVNHAEDGQAPILSKDSVLGLGIAVAAAGVVVWVIARDTSDLQALGAAVLAGMAGAFIGHLSAPHAKLGVYVGAIALLGVIGPITGLLIAPSGGPERAAVTGELFALARLSPLDWLAGAWIGLPLGMSDAATRVERHGGGKK